jgi:membrane-anchored protein YejM (alkaline phosphatase superfamily)
MRKGICLNGDLYSTRLIQTFEQFSTIYANECHFSFNFITKLTHDNPNDLKLHDEPLNEALKRLATNGLLKNTVMIILGDHGQRIHPIQTMYSGRIEERSPFMSIYIPKKYRNKYPDKYQNLQINTVSLINYSQ